MKLARWFSGPLLLAVSGCGSGVVGSTATAVSPQPKSAEVGPEQGEFGPVMATLFEPGEPEFPPRAAYLAGLMPLKSIGVPRFRQRYPRYDGRGAVIGILDTGIDPDLPGFRTTTIGAPKILDVRDFSGEGLIRLQRLAPPAGGILVSGNDTLRGASRLMAVASPPFWGGTFREIDIGALPAADVNGDGDNDDSFMVVVARAPDGWVMMTDTDGDGTLSDERAYRDFLQAAETFTYTVPGVAVGPLTIAVNFSEHQGEPELSFFFDNQGHGSHVAGIAAGHDMFGVPGFDGVAPGAQILALKISNNGRGAVTVTGSVVRAMNYAADYAERRGLPLILNLSFGIGNVSEGSAAIDSIVNQFALKHPNILFVSSTGNDGPGISTVSVPASADLAVSVCALYPAEFPQAGSYGGQSFDVVAWWSARGGETAKPDICAPGLAFSNVPRWQAGEEISPGTSMASPQIAGAAAILSSAMLASGRSVRAIDLKMALVATAKPMERTTVLDQGRGVPDLTRALWWLQAGHQAGVYLVRTIDGGTPTQAAAAYRRDGLERGDTIQEFLISPLNGQPAAGLHLWSDAPWLGTPESLEFDGQPVRVRLSYETDSLVEPGLYVGTVWARSATDTLAGALFGMRNTVVIPHPLEGELVFEDDVSLGEFDRFFVRVGEPTTGLTVELELEQWSNSASLHLFEPSGQPYRGGGIAMIHEGNSAARLVIPANAGLPGVYEIVVTTSDASRVEYRLVVTAPVMSVSMDDEEPMATVKNLALAELVAVPAARILGARSSFTVGGLDDTPAVAEFDVPDWAHEIAIGLSFDDGVWRTLSDLGVAIVSADGHILFAESINYALHQTSVLVEESWRGERLQVELMPGFSHIGADENWSAEVSVSMLLVEPVDLEAVPSAGGVKLRLRAGEFQTVRLGHWDASLELPAGSVPLVEFVVKPLGGAATTFRGTARLSMPPGGRLEEVQ